MINLIHKNKIILLVFVLFTSMYANNDTSSNNTDFSRLTYTIAPTNKRNNSGSSNYSTRENRSNLNANLTYTRPYYKRNSSNHMKYNVWKKGPKNK